MTETYFEAIERILRIVDATPEEMHVMADDARWEGHAVPTPTVCRDCGAYWQCEHRVAWRDPRVVDMPPVGELRRLDDEARATRKRMPSADVRVDCCPRCGLWNVLVEGVCDECAERMKSRVVAAADSGPWIPPHLWKAVADTTAPVPPGYANSPGAPDYSQWDVKL